MRGLAATARVREKRIPASPARDVAASSPAPPWPAVDPDAPPHGARLRGPAREGRHVIRWLSLRTWTAPSGGPSAARRDDGIPALAQRVFWAWCAAAGVALFAGWWLQAHGWWRVLAEGDPSGISIGTVALSVVVTLWCGRRCWQLQAMALPGSPWRTAFVTEHGRSADVASQLLGERSHGPHETAWWFAAATIKLGLLGTVVGFIVMASQIGNMPSFDIDQVQNLLKKMTQGMAIALYTTLVGLIANLWLGLQLMLMDRLADRIAADILADVAPDPAAGAT
jgi:MotA/TolQ/ExbB proton channel family